MAGPPEPDVPTKADVAGLDGIDSRNDGGYITVEPPVVAEDGQPAGTYAWVNVDGVVWRMPEWLIKRLTAKKAGAANEPGGPTR